MRKPSSNADRVFRVLSRAREPFEKSALQCALDDLRWKEIAVALDELIADGKAEATANGWRGTVATTVEELSEACPDRKSRRHGLREPAQAARETLVQCGLSEKEGPGSWAIDEYRRGRRSDDEEIPVGLFRDAIRDLEAAVVALVAAMRRGNQWEVGDALLNARQRVRRWAAAVEDRLGPIIVPMFVGEPPNERPARPISVTRQLAVDLHIADRRLLDMEIMISDVANYRPRELPLIPGEPPRDHIALGALRDAIGSLRRSLATSGRAADRRGRRRDDATWRLLWVVERFRRDDAADVPKIAAALLTVANLDSSAFPSVVKMMRIAYRRIRERRAAFPPLPATDQMQAVHVRTIARKRDD